MKILIIEDDPETRDLLRRHLTKQGMKTEEAENGRVGLERIGEVNPDLILLDLMMPGINGFDVVKALSDQPATARHAHARVVCRAFMAVSPLRTAPSMVAGQPDRAEQLRRENMRSAREFFDRYQKYIL